MRSRQYATASLVIAVVAFLLSISSAIGWWHLDGNIILGEPLYRSRFLTIYPPWSALHWWLAWGDDAEFRGVVWDGIGTAMFFGGFVGVLAGMFMHGYGPMERVEAEDQPDRFGTVRELLRSDRISTSREGVVLGCAGRKIVYHVGDDHVLVIGPSRVGEKGRSFVLPTLADFPHSVIVYDPKGELFEATADERARRGPVFLWDPTRPGTHRYNPLLEMRSDERNIGDCQALSSLMTHDLTGRDPFWATAAADLIAGCLRIVSTDGGPRTLERVREMVLGVMEGRRPATGDTYAQQMLATHMALEWRPRSGVEAQARLALRSLGDPVVASATAYSEFRVADLCTGPQPVTVYMTLPASQAESLRGIARITLQSMLLGVLHDRRYASNGQRKRRRILLLLDEFPALGHLPFIERGLAQVAGYGLKAMLICQSVEQIKDTYGQNETILGNIGTFAWVPGLSRGTYEEATATAGTIIASLRARHKTLGVIQRAKETVSQSRHPVLNPRELQLRARDEALIFHVGRKPTWVRKCRWDEQPRYRGRIKDVHEEFAG